MMQDELNLPSPPTSTVVEDHRSPKDTPETATELPYGYDVPVTGKQGHRFLGCMCDMRQTVIAVNIISIIWAILAMFVGVAGLVSWKNWENKEADDTTITIMPDVARSTYAILVAFEVIAILVFSLGIRGARKFNRILVAIAMVYHAIALIYGLITMYSFWRLFELLLSALFVYPHAVLFWELKHGVMTKENYESQRKACCGP
jgi:hypothetical protein